MNLLSIYTGYALDLIIGDPYSFPHPVRYIGKLISMVEKQIRKITSSDKGLKIAGFFLWFIVVGLTFCVTSLILQLFKFNKIIYFVVNTILIYTTLATKCLKDESVLNTEYPMPIAETASTFCETIVKKAAIKEADKITALAILESEISDCNQVIVDIYSRFLFEKSLFEARKESALTVDQIKKLMLDAQREAYGDGLDPEYLHPYMWTWKPHYYYANSNFYNFPYAFGLLFAKGLYAEYLKKGSEFSSEYENLLSITGKHNIADITKEVGIDIHNKEFWKSSLRTIEEDIDKFMELSKELL